MNTVSYNSVQNCLVYYYMYVYIHVYIIIFDLSIVVGM